MIKLTGMLAWEALTQEDYRCIEILNYFTYIYEALESHNFATSYSSLNVIQA